MSEDQVSPEIVPTWAVSEGEEKVEVQEPSREELLARKKELEIMKTGDPNWNKENSDELEKIRGQLKPREVEKTAREIELENMQASRDFTPEHAKELAGIRASKP